MNLPRFALTHRSLVMVAALVVFAAGLMTFQTMPRREDPEIVIRNTVVISNWPGAPADKVDELLADPIERKIQEMDDIETIKTQSLTGQVIVNVEPPQITFEAPQIVNQVEPTPVTVEGATVNVSPTPVVIEPPHVDVTVENVTELEPRNLKVERDADGNITGVSQQ